MKKTKKIYRRRRILVCLFLLAVSFAAVSAVRTAINATPFTQGNDQGVVYGNKEVDSSQIRRGELILVNNQTKFTFPKNSDLKSVFDLKSQSYQVKDKQVLLNGSILPPLNAMLDGFQAKKGENDLLVLSGHRTEAYQQKLLEERTASDGKAEAEKWVAAPGGSEHHTGYALDFGLFRQGSGSWDYTGEGKYAWLNENCWRYGFIVRYPADKTELTGILYEPWHFRYVGPAHAAVIREKGFCLEEYIDYLKHFPHSREHLQVEAGDGKRYEVYYVKAEKGKTKLPVPENKPYTVSGNNIDGFVVTVELG